MKNVFKLTACAVVASVLAGASGAAVSPDEAKQLGATLTLFGAEQAGNADGSIPAYKAELAKAPASYDPKDPYRLPNPFDDKPLFTITAQNLDKYADKLSEGQKNLFKVVPDFHMNIYPTRRTAYFPKFILDNTVKNATACKGDANELALVECYSGVPFPIPKTGNQVIWNRLVKYLAYNISMHAKSFYVTPSGAPVLQSKFDGVQQQPIYDPKHTGTNSPEAVYAAFRMDTLDPARRAGEKLVVINPVDLKSLGTRVYQYVPGQRRVKLAPDLTFDTPAPTSGGISTMDENGLFFGSLERYNFKLAGKKEMYIMYNTYDADDYKKCPEEVFFKKGFQNSDCVRWELHRVWAVDAKIKPEYRHIYPHRVIYIDEDTWGAGSADNFDGAGKLFRADFVIQTQYYPAGDSALPTHNITNGTTTVDFQTGAYFYSRFVAYPGGGVASAPAKPATYFSPEALAGQGIR